VLSGALGTGAAVVREVPVSVPLHTVVALTVGLATLAVRVFRTTE
jgi:hypothetical protein